MVHQLIVTIFQVRQNALSSVRSRSTTTRKAGNLATILIVIGLCHQLPLGSVIPSVPSHPSADAALK